jgi:acetylornithine deacetylase/succinyl-diaminopimelate desuccinylase-like protein
MDVPSYVELHAREFTDDLKQWLAIPSISGDPARHGDVRRSAEWLAAHLGSIGFPVAEVWESSPAGLPAVFAEWPSADPGAPVVLVYGHHDVQPVRPCRSPITSPAVRAGRRAMERAFGREVLFTKEGGSGPEADLAEILAAPLVFVAVGLDSDQIHAPNEKTDISLLLRGAEASAYLWEELAAIGADLS